MKLCPFCWSWENPTRTFGPTHPCFTVYDAPPDRPSAKEPQ